MKPFGSQESGQISDDAPPRQTDDEVQWGDHCEQNKDNNLRIMGIQSDGLPHNNAHFKNDIISECVNQHNPDVICFSECNVAWHKVEIEHRLGERMKDCFGTAFTQCAWYRKYPAQTTKRQFGGCAIVILGNSVGRVVGSGSDPTGLGRWCWIRLQGKENSYIRIVSAYRPVKNEQYDNSVYSQQKTYLEANKKFDLCPRAQFTEDLEKEIQHFKSKGDDVLLSLDLNEEVWDPLTQFAKAMITLCLSESITGKHGTS